jgi:D-tagatose-1,6-bisphosphate aldolase subunit GatZ/KbaZ
VGTDLHTTTFDPGSARRVHERVAPLGSLVKGHYTDWVANPADYPATGMGGANVGPEFTATELAALHELCTREACLMEDGSGLSLSGFKAALRAAVVASDRWQKWLAPEEIGRSFDEVAPARRRWLVATGARYVWIDPQVLAARQRLYDNLRSQLPDAHSFVVDRIAQNMQMYVDAFNLKNSLPLLT